MTPPEQSEIEAMWCVSGLNVFPPSQVNNLTVRCQKCGAMFRLRTYHHCLINHHNAIRRDEKE